MEYGLQSPVGSVPSDVVSRCKEEALSSRGSGRADVERNGQGQAVRSKLNCGLEPEGRGLAGPAQGYPLE
jgi:hypothetical protein